jgi:restriction system protein
MPLPDHQALMLPLLKRAALGELRVLEAEKLLGDEFNLTQEERDQLLSSGKRVLHNRAHWAKFYLMKAGLVSFPRRGTFVATDAGRALLARNPSRIDVELLRTYPPFEEFYRGGAADDTPATTGALPASANSAAASSGTPEEQIEKALLTVHSALRTELLQRIMQNTPAFFEGLIIDLLVKMGYGGSRPDAAAQLGRSGDGGVDGVINEDRLGLDRVYLQAKRYADGNAVGRPEVQKFLGSLVGMGATKGVFVTTSKFSSDAVEFARHLSQRIILIDGSRLTELMIEHGVGVRLSRAIEFKRLDENFFDEEN